ncbi:hypothetical protein RHCRD62_60463 [Rhodococcus sp. RD6.2]|nr:hypothetical protein RHCRD62_60463 [Rhodococcus sp. RD6.2]
MGVSSEERDDDRFDDPEEIAAVPDDAGPLAGTGTGGAGRDLHLPEHRHCHHLAGVVHRRRRTVAGPAGRVRDRLGRGLAARQAQAGQLTTLRSRDTYPAIRLRDDAARSIRV